MRKLLVALSATLIVGLLVVTRSSCAQRIAWPAVERMIEAEYPGVPSITTDSLATLLNRSHAPVPVLLDARQPEEYAVSHLKGALRVDPGATTFPRLDSLDADTPIVVYCSVGYRSAGITERLRDAGFTNVANLEGSIFQWANEGRPVYRKGERVQAVHPYNKAWGQLLDAPLRAEGTQY